MAQGRRQRFRRLGSTTAVSAGALTLVFFGAPPAYAGTAAPQPCAKGVDPATTIENWKCQLGNLRESVMPSKTPAPSPSPSKKPALKPSTSGKSGKTSSGSAPKSRSTGGGGGGQTSSGNGPSALSRPGSVQPYTDVPSAAPNLPGVLPTPEIAADPRAYLQRPAGGATPQTRLISPVASSERDDAQMAWVAAAAAAAGAVGALNLSVLGRGIRRRTESGR